jgi:hypothetical protein
MMELFVAASGKTFVQFVFLELTLLKIGCSRPSAAVPIFISATPSGSVRIFSDLLGPAIGREPRGVPRLSKQDGVTAASRQPGRMNQAGNEKARLESQPGKAKI